MRPELARALAAVLLEGAWTPPRMLGRVSRLLGRPPPWARPLLSQLLEVYPQAPLDRPRELAATVAALPAAETAGAARPLWHPAAPTRMIRNPWHLPVLHELGDVAHLLALTPGELAWFSDPGHLARATSTPALLHYRVSTRSSASGGVRVLEAPKPRLRHLQRRLLAEVLDGVPAHDAAHGFRRHRSVGTYAAPHTGHAVVIRLDLEGFFASVTVGRVYGVLRTAGYPEPVAHCLSGLVTTVLPRSAWATVPRPADSALLEAHWRLGRRLASPHLPQGAPTSPALANLAAHHLDVRLSALLGTWGGVYTRYADDLALSGTFRAPRLLKAVGQVVTDEGFRFNAAKTAVQPASGRQVLGGLVVNVRPHVGRREVDLLRAVLHNCRVHGPSTQNREGHPDLRAHLTGRVSWIAQHDPARGTLLRAQLDAIDWSR